jgi:hypothetical protein
LDISSPSSASPASRMRRQMLCLAAMRNHHRYLPSLFLYLSYMITYAVKRHPFPPSSTSAQRLRQGRPDRADPSSTTSFSTEVVSSCHRHPAPGRPFCNTPMAWAMRVSRRRFIGCVVPSSGHRMHVGFVSSSRGALSISATRQSTCTRRVSSSHSTFPPWCGRTLPWTSSMGSRK